MCSIYDDMDKASAAPRSTIENSNVRALLDALRAIAQEGLSYSQNAYDTARYVRLLDLASMEYAELTGMSKEEIRETFLKEQGSITPKVGVDVAVVNDKGNILVLRRGDSSWCMPAGWADVGESPFETARRETFEESGLKITPVGYIGIAHKTPQIHPGFASQVNICVAIEPVSSALKVGLSHEHNGYRWINSIDEIDNWHAGQKQLITKAFAAYEENSFIPNID
jgi:8-oxo-dGTP pyrophosphatase MutT (NUDIX family)